MGIGYTVDTPLKVSQYGIDSVISLVDDILLEKLRKMYCEKLELPYHEISEKIDDFRARRITVYLNLINSLAEKKFEELKNITIEKAHEIKEFFSMLPDSSTLKQEFMEMTAKHFHLPEIKEWLHNNLSMGSIDVNIMTKLDRENYRKNEQLPIEYNDAHAALRGFANSDLQSSLILSAGMSPRLYGYMEKFEDFYPDQSGNIKKKIILKVSDYRSAFIQGKFLAKKGLWVSEYRVESGLNCGGHAFATEGFLMGPILDEFKNHRATLTESVHKILTKALKGKNRPVPSEPLPLKITAQGGVGTAEEHNFLLEHYQIDSVGWGTPFLLAPDIVNIDEDTLHKLEAAKEENLYLSNCSPVGVPYNTLRGNSKDIEREKFIANGKPGSTCPQKHLSFSKEFTKKPLCTASRSYQHLKLKELDAANLPEAEYKKQYNMIIEKECICVGLGTAALLVNNIDTKTEGPGVSVCPGPNMAYFSKKTNLKELINHIYGKTNLITRTDRPHMFVNELKIYTDYLKNIIEDAKGSMTEKQEKYFLNFSQNLQNGIAYYNKLFSSLNDKFQDTKSTILNDLDAGLKALHLIKIEK
jgi:hypothetical protein